MECDKLGYRNIIFTVKKKKKAKGLYTFFYWVLKMKILTKHEVI